MIRPLLSSDRDAWLQLWLGYQAFYEVQIAPAVTEITWSRLFDAAEPMHCAVAEEDGAVVGIVHYIFHRSTWTEGDYCYLQDLFVSPDVRGRGCGRQLIEHVYAQAQAQQAARVYWLTHESNQQAMVLYDKVAKRSGFIQYRHVLG
ncbi:MAG: family N-acetyltransferase [Rhizobacter sp.]|nr:family N-acetyltransferase [Rhizobacter sp.]